MKIIFESCKNYVEKRFDIEIVFVNRDKIEHFKYFKFEMCKIYHSHWCGDNNDIPRIMALNQKTKTKLRKLIK